MPRSTIYYMITINQTANCSVPFEECFKRAVTLSKELGSRFVVSREEGSRHGKLHVHICIELHTDKRQDNLKKWFENGMEIDIEKPTIKICGTAKLPHKDSWEKEAVAYAAKDADYVMKGFEKEEIDEIIESKKINDEVTQKCIYVQRPAFWREYYLLRYSKRVDNHKDAILEICKTCIPLFLKDEKIPGLIIEYQLGELHPEELWQVLSKIFGIDDRKGIRYKGEAVRMSMEL